MQRKKENIVRSSEKGIWDRVQNRETKTDWARVNAMTEEEIERNALEENRRLGIPDDWYKDAYAVYPVEKDRITIRIDRDVLEYFRTRGKGYQSRMNAVLRAFMAAELRSGE